MNYRPMLEKLADFQVNFAVASFAVSAFQEVWYGIIPGIVFLLGTIVTCSFFRESAEMSSIWIFITVLAVAVLGLSVFIGRKALRR